MNGQILGHSHPQGHIHAHPGQYICAESWTHTQMAACLGGFSDIHAHTHASMYGQIPWPR